MRLGVKFAVAVLGLVLVVLGGLGWAVVHSQNQIHHDQSLQRARLVLSFGESSREYTREIMAPAVRRSLDTHKGGLVFEAESATFVARGTFAALSRREKGYTFREAALNPLNPENRADDEERKLISDFRRDPARAELIGYRTVGGLERFYVARPVVVTAACLNCHGDPGAAPPELVARYGNESGFGWAVGEVCGAIMVLVPTEDLRLAQRATTWTVISGLAGLAVLLVTLIVLLFEGLVSGRLRQLSRQMVRVADQPGSADGALPSVPEIGRDEVTAVTRAFNRLALAVASSHNTLEALVAQRTSQLVQANGALALEVEERRLAEAAARLAQVAAEGADRAKRAFLANMSHELRTPFGGVLGMTDLALQTELTSEQRNYLTLVRTSADGLLGVLGNILEFASLEAGRLSLAPAPFAPRELLADTLRPLAQRAADQGLAMAWEVADDVPVTAVGDAGRLTQILTCLVANAIKFTIRGGVSVSLGLAGPPEVDGSFTLRASVRDTGIGVPPELHRIIFEPFEQADTSPSRRYGGAGLGLAIAARLVELMGGSLTLDSEPGRGSTFTFTARLTLTSPTPSAPQS